MGWGAGGPSQSLRSGELVKQPEDGAAYGQDQVGVYSSS